jgi:hypothetical protein
MACRLLNRHKHPLHIDLRGGETLTLKPGETSGALLEELLYDNQHLPQWEASGWVVRLPARFAETQPQAAPAEPPEEEEQDEEPEAQEEEPEEGSDTESPKRRRRRTRR